MYAVGFAIILNFTIFGADVDRGGDEAEEVVLQVTALPILYVVRSFTTRRVLYAQPVSLAGYSDVYPRHLGQC